MHFGKSEPFIFAMPICFFTMIDMKILKSGFTVAVLTVLASGLLSCSSSKKTGSGQLGAQEIVTYDRLIIRDLDEMNKIIRRKITESRNSPEKIIPLREAMQIVYSRPNDDFMIEKIAGSLQSELDDLDARETTMRSLIDDGVQALKEPSGLKAEVQVTYAIMLENFMAELRPDAEKPFERSVFTQIRDANIQTTREAASERSLRIMRKTKSPSEIAETVLKEVEQSEKTKKNNDDFESKEIKRRKK